jgi:hypothetical protein
MNNRFVRWFASVRRALRGSYVCLLEDELRRSREDVARERAEVARLRLENRALLNSLLGTAGVPPVEEPSAHRYGGQAVAAVRRRSWPQIAASRESEAERRSAAHQRNS